MAFFEKSKVAGFLRGLMGRASGHEAPRPPASQAPAPPPMPARQPVAAQTAPAPVPAAPALTGAPARVAANMEAIELPLISVVAALPVALKSKLVAEPAKGQTIRLATARVVNQLALGAVKITFGELRQLAAGAFAGASAEFDNQLISLPLQEILPRVNPAWLTRRTAKKVDVAQEIVGPFGGRGEGFSFTTQPLKVALAPAPSTPPAPAPAPAPAPPIAFVSPMAPREAAPPVAPPMPPRPSAPANGTHGSLSRYPAPSTPATPAPRLVTPAAGSASASGGRVYGGGNGAALPPGLRLGSMSGHTNRAEVPPIRMAAQSTPAPAPAPLRLVSDNQPVIYAPLAQLCENWPANLKEEILNSPLARVNVALAGASLMPGLKRGRVVMTWKQLRLLAQPGSLPSPGDNLELELPLKVIAPLFMAAQKAPGKAQAKASVSANIPDLFFGFPPPAAPVASPTPVAPPPAAAPAETPPQETNFYSRNKQNELVSEAGPAVQTDFMTRQAHPKEVVARAVALPGVAGALVAMQDGLRVASQTPAELNADTLAAFLPQIFERVNQSTRELRMGSLNEVSFTVGNVPWEIFRINAVYFAAFGRVGEPLPLGQLARLAAELDRKKQQ